MNPTQQPVKRALVMPEPIPDSEAERTLEANHMVAEVRKLGPEAWKSWTSFELETLSELNDGKACTRIRFKIVREAYNRIRKQFTLTK